MILSMSNNIWYISKYVAPPYAAKVSSRGFLILRSMAEMGRNCILITSDSNHLISAPSFDGKMKDELVAGVTVRWLKTTKYSGARSFGRMLSWLDFEWQLFKMPKKKLPDPDVIIVSSLSLLTILNGLLLKRKYKCKLVFEVRDIWPLVLVSSGGLSTNNPFIVILSWLEKLGYNSADRVVGTMPNLEQHVYNVTGKKKKVDCIPQVIDEGVLADSCPLDQLYVDKYIPKDKFIICHAGSIGADNALETFFDCARAMQDDENIHFLVVGDGYLKQKFLDENKDLINLTFAPRVEKNQVQSVLDLVDVVYFAVNKSPLWIYGQSLNKVVDYMLSGKPILASYSGYPSMINESGCGFFVPTEDVSALKNEIQRFSKLPSNELRQMGDRGREWILSNRLPVNMAIKYLNIIDDITS